MKLKIKFKINGMHCQGCVNLIKLAMEEYGFTNVEIDGTEGTGVVQTNTYSFGDAEKDINAAFAEIAKYTVTGIKQIE